MDKEKFVECEYKDRIVCYLDILGWKEKVDFSEKNDLILNYLYNHYKNFIDSFKQIGEIYSIKVNIVSDSFFLSWRPGVCEATKNILNILKFKTQEMCVEGYLVRGSIRRGKFIHEKDILFGPALVEAYENELKCAIYPRIIFGEDIKSDYLCGYDPHAKEGFFPTEENFKNVAQKESDGFYYLDYLSFPINSCIEGVMDSPQFYEKFRKIIIRGLDEKQMPIRMKYEWLKSKYNEAIRIHVRDEMKRFKLHI